MQFMGLSLDKFQEEAIGSIDKKHSVLVSAPTGSGKTLIADYIIDKYLKRDKRVIYTAPIKALSNQKFKDFCEQYGEDRIGLITGDVVINSGAQVLLMTTEVYRNMAIINDPILDSVSYCIMDEIHFISDEERGYIWEESIIFSPKNIRFLFLSATIPNEKEFASWVKSIKEHEVKIIRHTKRSVPLARKFYDAEMGITTLPKIKERKKMDKIPEYRQLKKGRYRGARIPLPDYKKLVKELKNRGALPCIYFVFSRAKTQEYAVKLSKMQFLSKKEHSIIRQEISEAFRGISRDVRMLKSVRDLRLCLPNGIGFHNAGMLPDIKHVVEKLFAKGLIKVLFATETFAVGINMPAKAVAFDSLRKYTGSGFRHLNSKEYFQISGRAGRRGIDKKGLSVAVIHRPAADIDQISRFTAKDTLPLRSQFKITHNTVLNMINLHNPGQVQKILTMNFFTFQKLKGTKNNRVLGSIKARFTKLENTLAKLGYIKDRSLTPLGVFASKIFSDVIEISELFGKSQDFDEYTTLLVLTALIYEPRRGVKFHKLWLDKTSDIKDLVAQNPALKGKWVGNIDRVTAIIHPIYSRMRFVDILKNTSMPEGDLIRILMQVLDKLEQIDRASQDYDQKRVIRNCKGLIKDCLEGIHLF